jgi:hypothetical protein
MLETCSLALMYTFRSLYIYIGHGALRWSGVGRGDC